MKPTLRSALALAAVLAVLPVSSQAAESTCARAVEMARDNIMLRINGGDNAQNSRESAKVHLDEAAIAAARGDEGGCWHFISWSGYLVGVPGPVAALMRNGMNATASGQS